MRKNLKNSYSFNGFSGKSRESDARKTLRDFKEKRSLVTLTIKNQEPINGKIKFGTSIRSERFTKHKDDETVSVPKYSKKYSRSGFHFIPNDYGKKLFIPLPKISDNSDNGFTARLEDYSVGYPPIIMNGEIKLT